MWEISDATLLYDRLCDFICARLADCHDIIYSSSRLERTCSSSDELTEACVQEWDNNRSKQITALLYLKSL